MKIELSDLKIGDIFLNNGFKNTLWKVENREASGSMSFDRTYWIIPMDIIEDIIDVNIKTQKLKEMAYPIILQGLKVPSIELCDEPPLKFEEVSTVKISRKQLKTVTYYE